MVLKLDAEGNIPASIKNPNIKVSELILYPNPSKSNLSIRTAIQRIGGEFEMCDISGKQVLQQKITKSITQINTNNLPAGT
ncbi:MAG TPA: T9SS type A sorting domain-containing protein, partial [Bacteroidetes bacterium]|nr:T9SS type A sorting domain-containing protein [Bacteroidota bacterium]